RGTREGREERCQPQHCSSVHHLSSPKSAWVHDRPARPKGRALKFRVVQSLVYGTSTSASRRVSANGRPAARGGVTRDERFSPSTSLGWSRSGPAFRPILNVGA